MKGANRKDIQIQMLNVFVAAWVQEILFFAARGCSLTFSRFSSARVI